MAKTTIVDIAAALGVTASTVSRALNGNTAISEATRLLVEEKAMTMGYVPNSLASALRSGKSYTIGILLPRADRLMFSNTIKSVEIELQLFGYQVIICQHNENVKKEKNAIDALLRARVDGVIASPAKDAPNLMHYENLTKNNIPVVFFDNVWENSTESAVLIDDYYGGYQATKHLIEQGCKTIAHITLPNNIKIYADRKRGYKDALLEANIPYDENLVTACVSDVEEGYVAAKKLFKNNPNIDAVFSTSDYSALGLYQYCKENNIKIPENVKIVGFGDASFTPYIEPAMSSVNQVSQAVGREAAALLLEHLSDGKKQPRKMILQPTLIIRKSSIQ